ncbi:MAG: hypothetical protein EAZ32_00665 [Cytophagia bacterium]|nr:MAG: hypothetical protein EAZ46_13060 [Runella sp.]TAG23605.1 MAG: hypothetical protein EAZ38_03055 [Cytophagales bacterium]TAG42774.1 MAG: hypothetical protein EAZ32_00665 [Cytophagia bacterium]TAG51244.1 MAG: hypothetical protein EAZ29_10235 [Runella slithyformis]TAG76385.1 MAG: hypothetical protein EAZ22_18255 [Cytophagales bacterium]
MFDKLDNSNLKNWFNVALLALALVPLLALAFYNHPSIVDDYCYIDTVFKYGYFEAMHHYYTGWTGRYFGILLNHSSPLIVHWYAGFKVLSVLLLVGLCGSIYWLIKTLWPQGRMLQIGGMLGVVFFLFVLKIASIVEAFYWMAAFVTYTIPNILTLCLIVVMVKYYEARALRQKLTAILAAFLVFATIGSSETNLLITVILVVGWFGYRLIIKQNFDRFALFLILIAGFSCYLSFASEGNAMRLAGNPVSGNLPLALRQSLGHLGQLSSAWLLHSPLLIFTFFWIIFLLKRPDWRESQFLAVPIWVAGIAYLGVLWSQLFTSFYGIGIESPPRVVNSVYLYFLLGWFYNVAVWVRYLAQKRTLKPVSSLTHWAFGILLFITVVKDIKGSSNLRMVYGDWLRGRAAAYNQELYERYAFINNTPADTVYVTPLRARPQSLFMDDLNRDPAHLWNRCVSGYFGKKVIYLKH